MGANRILKIFFLDKQIRQFYFADMKKLFTFLSIVPSTILLLQLGACTSKSVKTSGSPALTAKSPDEISIMTFNVENLFDTVHDKNREDFAYLPLSQKNTVEVQNGCNQLSGFYKRECFELDWNEGIVEKKMKNIAEVIQSVEEKRGPDVLILVEVENENVLSIFNKKHLQNSGYVTQVLIEGPDTRGIDLAVLSRFPIQGKAQLHKIPYKAEKPQDQEWMNKSRGVLEVPLKLPDGNKLTVFAAHFPSQRNPRYWRTQSVAFMKTKLEQMKNEMVVLGGDLNISQDEEDATGFFSKDFSSVGSVSHLVGCHHCDGSHEYRSTWSFLDALVFSQALGKNGTGPYKLVPESIDVVKFVPNHIYKGRSPRRFDEKTGEGVSDHFPIYARIKKRDAATP